MGEKGRFCTRKVPSLAEGASYLFKRVHSCVGRAFFVPEGRLYWRKGRRIYLGGAAMGEKCIVLYEKGASVGEMAPL